MGVVGRYAIFDEIASGGMAAVHLARLNGPIGFARTVAVKRLHAHVLDDAEAALMFVDEARLAARIHHPNVVQTLDVIEERDRVLIVMDYVHGESLSRLLRASRAAGKPVDASILCAIITGALHGLHSAHEAVSERGEPLAIVHRDISPQNILVGVDGVPRVLDFGIAKARQRLHTTRDGKIRGKLAYMPPEQLDGRVDRRTDVYAIGVVMWEALTGLRLFAGKDDGETMSKLLHAPVEPPSAHAHVDGVLDRIVMRAIERQPDARYATAREMAAAIEGASALAPGSRVGEWVESNAHEALARRAALVRAIEAGQANEADETPPQSGEARPSREPTVAERVVTPEDPSSISVAHAARGSSSYGKRAAIVAGAVAVASALAFALTTRRGSDAPITRSVASVAPVVASTAAVVVVEVSPPASTVVVEAQPRTRPVTRPSPTAPATTGSTKLVPIAKNPCDPPYRVGSAGEKIWIADCL